MIEFLVKGGVAAFLGRELFSGIRGALKQRADEVKIAKALAYEIQTNHSRIMRFCNEIDQLITSNNGRNPNSYIYQPSFECPVDFVFRIAGPTIFSIINRHSESVSANLIKVYSLSESTNSLLQLYRGRFMGNFPITYTSDPHLQFRSQYQSMGLRDIETEIRPVNEAVQKVIDGNWIWQTIRNKKVHRALSIFCGIFLLFLPESESL